jgi:hypothetical protein
MDHECKNWHHARASITKKSASWSVPTVTIHDFHLNSAPCLALCLLHGLSFAFHIVYEIGPRGGMDTSADGVAAQSKGMFFCFVGVLSVAVSPHGMRGTVEDVVLVSTRSHHSAFLAAINTTRQYKLLDIIYITFFFSIVNSIIENIIIAAMLH